MKNVIFTKVIVTIVSIFVISGCYTKKAAIKKFCCQDSVLVTLHDTITVSLPQDTAKFSLAIDSLKNKIAQLEGDTAATEPPARTIYEDSLIHLTAKLNKKTKSLQWELTHKKPLVKQVPVKVEVKVPCNCPGVAAIGFEEWFSVQPLYKQSGIVIICLLALMALMGFIGNRFNKWLSK
jgi:hypothetical protein